MTELTKEQLIEEVKLKIAIAKCHPNSGMARVELELFKIALASLEAEPIAWECGENTILFNPDTVEAYAKRAGISPKPLYAAPPAQVLSSDGVEPLEEFVWTGEEWSVPLTGCEPEDDVPESFSASISAGCVDDVEVWVSVPPYMIIPCIEGVQDEDLFNTCSGALRVSLLDLLKAYTNSCIREDAGDGVLYMANFFERMSKSLRRFYGTLPQEEIAAAKADVDLVIPWERGGREEGDK